MCRSGVHACARADLPRWIWEELWVAELDGEVESGQHKLRASRGRLVRRVGGWTAPAARDFAEACAWRARDRALDPLAGPAESREAAERLQAASTLEDVRGAASVLWDASPREVRIPLGMASDGALRAMSARTSQDRYEAAQGGAVCGYIAAMTAGHAGGLEALEEERAWQAAWLADRLELEPA
jgi:hypothetical protein